MAETRDRNNRHVAKITEVLRREYLPDHPRAQIDVYRYNSACVEIRIVDEEFRGTSIVERGSHVWEILQKSLPESIGREISLVLMLAPEETTRSATNYQFEYPEYTPGAYFGNGKLPPVKRYVTPPPWLRPKTAKKKRSPSVK
jgi:stress-induced morphogen